MKKLSEIPMNEYICVNGIEGLITKEDYLDSVVYYDKEDVEICETIKKYAEVSDENIERILEDLLEDLADGMYEDWYDDVRDDVLACPELKMAIDAIREILKGYPTYYEGNRIINDMLNDNPKESEANPCSH